MLNKITGYFRACYQADNRDLVIKDFFSTKVEKRYLFEGSEELINGFLPYTPIPNEEGEELSKILKIYQKEKELFYCSLFIVGNSTESSKKNTRICAPLFMYPAQLHYIDENFYVEISKSHRRVNYSVLSELRGDSDDNSEFFNELLKNLPDENVKFGDVGGIMKVIAKYIPEIDISETLLFPKLIDTKKFKRIVQPKRLADSTKIKIIISSGIGLISKSVDTLGILNEMAEIAKNDTFSPPLRSMFNKEKIEFSDDSIGRVPAILSLAQQKLFDVADKNPFTLAVGPPGTGKSYTIAALAIELFSKGKSVLIASRTDQAVDVVADKIEQQFGIDGVIVRGGKSSYLRDLRKMLQSLLSGMRSPDKNAQKNLKASEKEFRKIDAKIAKLESEFERRVEKEQDWGSFLANNIGNKNFFTGLKTKYINWRTDGSKPHWELISELENLLQIENTKTVEYIMEKYSLQVEKTLNIHRDELNGFLQALKARRSTRQSELFENLCFDTILSTFPIWLVKLTDIYRVLPLIPEMFDYVIIDEATQCDVATCIPALQRAKQAVFTGDPNQLRHISFLAKSRQELLLKEYDLEEFNIEQLNYRKKSILDFVSEGATNQNQVVFLNEHYRSTPAIIRFSNEHFYSNTLNIMTEKPDTSSDKGLVACFCNGERNKNGVNIIESEFILAKIKEIINTQKDLSDNACQSIGILSPFRNQVDFTSNLVSRSLSINEIERHKIIVATAYGFQGEERDAMFISFALDNESHPAAFYHLNKPDVFNVSITRARSVQYLVYSVAINKLKPDSLFRKYLESVDNQDIEDAQTSVELKDNFQKEVTEFLGYLGVQVWPAYAIAGHCIDIVLKNKEKTMGIDLIGFPGEYADAFSLERYKMLNRAGVRTFPLPYTFWIAERKRCEDELKSWINVYA